MLNDESLTRMRQLYNGLIEETLRAHHIAAVHYYNEETDFFDTIKVTKDGLEVYRYGLDIPNKGFGFFFGVDYARLLLKIEEELQHFENGHHKKTMFFVRVK